MNIQKMLLIALLGAAVSATTMPTLGKVIGFGHAAAYAADADQGNDVQGDDSAVDEDGNGQ
jgi:hypothetical protein